ncbi:SDR family NAD(P)-dependent oxidoreductase [Paenibacillus eucommiae]|uniref:NAD(P)-dependent dehydrogenase (Short-subunit alcohol dehydrogenase family) n=1 Tax=Paenibacillus eucommiae TaxID=1355755 RepID=A0ABS4INA9_9BACL|nr:SDR family NAD(P)-dependent oxidoreductase [Paenibacillus eucommiae]MBP1988516.1 NAD(P)-dependent dehydrogenase (short-subunit alcohol dehydrogenase family) [Paenibacillus eucommiae]
MEQKLQGKVALITGAAQGMGKDIARLLARQGAKVVMNDLSGEALQAAAEDIRRDGGEAIWVKADVSKREEVASMIDQATEAYSTIDILVNNAGLLRSTPFVDVEDEEWDLVMEVNLKSVYLSTKAVVPLMIANKGGKIINMSSSAGRSVSTLGGAHYTTSKAAVLGLTRHLAKELASHNIRVNAVCPGLIDTEMVRKTCPPEQIAAYESSFPIQRLGTTREVADLVLFLASDDSSYITGASIDINGGDLMI